jgi:hypothetical protein
MKNAPFKFRPDNWLDFFAGHGWHPREIRYLGIEGIKRGRRAPFPWRTRVMMRIARLFTRKSRHSRLERMLGYAVLEPVSEDAALHATNDTQVRFYNAPKPAGKTADHND